MRSQRGFSLIEIIVVIAILGILIAVVAVAVNPSRYFARARNSDRISAVAKLQGAINQYALENNGSYPPGIDGTLRMIGTATDGCSISCPGTEIVAERFNAFDDDSQAEFSAGTHSATQWSTGAHAVTLTAGGLAAQTGTYTSNVKDAGQPATWTSIGWIPRAPYGKELPGPNTVKETGYTMGNMDMTGNVLLLHMNEASGSVLDSSGNNLNGTVSSFSYGATAKFKTGMLSPGGTGSIQVPHNSKLNLPDSGGAISLWMKPIINAPQNTGMGVLRKPDDNSNWFTPGGYGIEIYRNEPGGPQNVKLTLGWNSGTNSAEQILIGTTDIQTGNWYHVVATWDTWTAWLYVNGVQEASASRTAALSWQTGNAPLLIADHAAARSAGNQWYNGTLDEFSLWSRRLTTTEVAALYQRGIGHPTLQVRSCDDEACSGESFVGPNNNTGATYSELINTSTTPAIFTLTGLPQNRYFQYKMVFNTDVTHVGPEVSRVTGANTLQGGYSAQTAASCLNLAPTLIPTYIQNLPTDPVGGSVSRTYYAVKSPNAQKDLIIRACTPELGDRIEVKQ